MGLASDMKNLSEDLLASFRQRIADNEELVNDVQKTLDGFRKDHQELASVLNANAAAQRKGRVLGEKERINTFNGLMNGIHETIAAIGQEVLDIQSSTLKMTNEFAADRKTMSADLMKAFSESKSGRKKDESERMNEFNSLMRKINYDISTINNEVLMIFKDTNDMIGQFETEHSDMSAALRTELSSNLAERVKYTGTLLSGFQKRLSDISKENQKMAQGLRKDLDKGESSRIAEYNAIMKGIQSAINGIEKDVNKIRKSTSGMLTDLSQNRSQASAEWINMQAAMGQIRKTGSKKIEKSEVVAEKKAIKKEAKVKKVEKIDESLSPMTLEEKVLGYINNHPAGVKIAEMEEPLGEIRMKLGYAAKNLLNEGKVQKVENVYFPVKAA